MEFEDFNPIIGLILTRTNLLTTPAGKFQSHYRSDFNYKTTLRLYIKIQFQSHYRSDFNYHTYHKLNPADDFNPIIGLILTILHTGLSTACKSFQSHYRSDFNLSLIISASQETLFQSHYRSDFNFIEV